MQQNSVSQISGEEKRKMRKAILSAAITAHRNAYDTSYESDEDHKKALVAASTAYDAYIAASKWVDL